MFAVVGMVLGSWAGRIPSVHAQVGLTDAQWGLVLLAAPVGSLVTLALVPRLITRVGARTLIRIGAAAVLVDGSSEYKRRVAAIPPPEQLPAEEHEQMEQVQKLQRQLYDAGFAGCRCRWSTAAAASQRHTSACGARSRRATSSTPASSSSAIGMAVPTLLGHGTEEQKAALPRPHAARRRGVVPALQRARRRLRPRRPRDHARVRDGDEFVVNGQKVWNSARTYADWGILLARTDPDVAEAPRHHVLPAST